MSTLDPDEFTGTWSRDELPSGVRLGQGCWIASPGAFDRFRSTRDPGCVLGDRVQVHMGTALTVEPHGQLIVGADSVLVSPVFMCAERIELGEGVVVSYRVTLADCDFHPVEASARRADAEGHAPGGDPSQQHPWVTAPVHLGDRVVVGIGAVILKGVDIGADAVVAPGAVVTRDVPAGARAAGNPARVVAR